MTRTKAPTVPTEKQPGKDFIPSAYVSPVTPSGDRLSPFRMKDATEEQIRRAVAPWIDRGFTVRVHLDPARLILHRIYPEAQL